MLELGRSFLKSGHYGRSFLRLFSLVSSPRLIYEMVFRWVGKAEFPHLESDLKVGSDGTLEARITILHVLHHSSAVLDEVAQLHDRSYFQHAELKQSRSEFLRVLEIFPEGILIHREGNILFANSSLLQMLDCPALEELVEKSRGMIPFPTNSKEWVFQTRQGRRLELELSSRETVHFEEASATLVVARDVSDQRELLRLQADQQKLAALGEMAAEMAHEIRNPLAARIHRSP